MRWSPLARNRQTIDDPEPIDLQSVVETAWRNVNTGDVTLEIAAETTVESDENRLLQLFENLFRNAIEHGGGSLTTVRIGELDTGGFYIEDDGVGISVAERGDVVEFGYSSTSTGTGYGLAIVTAIVEAHGWTFTVLDGSDGGARFEIGTTPRDEQLVPALSE